MSRNACPPAPFLAIHELASDQEEGMPFSGVLEIGYGWVWGTGQVCIFGADTSDMVKRTCQVPGWCVVFTGPKSS